MVVFNGLAVLFLIASSVLEDRLFAFGSVQSSRDALGLWPWILVPVWSLGTLALTVQRRFFGMAVYLAVVLIGGLLVWDALDLFAPFATQILLVANVATLYADWRFVIRGQDLRSKPTDRAIPAPIRLVRAVSLAVVIAVTGVMSVIALFYMLLAWSTDAAVEQARANGAGMEALIKQDLPLGSSVARAHAFMRSQDALGYVQSHGFDPSSIEASFKLQRVRAYDQNNPNSQSYPHGSLVAVWLNPTQNSSNSVGMDVEFTFDARGRLTSYSASQGVITL